MPSTASTERPPGLLRRVRHELQRRDVRVRHVQPQGPGLQAVTFGGPALASFVSLSFDDHVKFIFTDAAGQEQRRDYTPRHVDPARNELTLVFALHEGGAASAWAQRARVGDAAVIGGPRGSIIIPDDLPWYLLAGDATALPAIARRLEELPAGTPTTVLLHTPQEQDLHALPERPGLQLRWLPSDQALCDALRTVDLPAGDGFVWCAGEAACMARLRDILLNERGLPRSHVKVSAYWKPGASDFHEDLA
jgi:NADPH-dependent ferric siderophore reductase